MCPLYTDRCIRQQLPVFDAYNVGCNCPKMELLDLKDRVRAARKHGGFKNQGALARVLMPIRGEKPPSQQLISKLETGLVHSSAYLWAIAIACRVSPAWLVHGQGDMLESRAVRTEHEKLISRRDEIGLSTADVYSRMLSFSWPEGVPPPDLATVEDWFSGRRRPADMTYREMLYRALELGTDRDVSMDEGVAKTEVGARLLRLAESGDPEEAAQMLALWETMRKSKGGLP